MNSRSIKLLTATTAFVAVAAVGNATTVSSSTTATLYTSATTGGITIAPTGSIVSTGSSSTIEISNTVGANNIISVSTGGLLQSGGSATILSTNAANAAVVINNSGTIVGTSKSIDLSNMTNGASIINSGTITGSVTFGNGTNSFNSTGTTSGTITGGTGNDTFTFTNTTHTGNIDLVSGTDTLTISNSRVNGNISATGVGGVTTLHLTNATVSGTIADGANNDNDVLTIDGTQTFTTLGNIAGFETVNINTNTVLNNALTGAQALTVAATKTLTANQSVQAGGLLTNNGEIDIAAGKTVQAATYAGTGTVGIAVASSSSTGKLGLTTTGAYATKLAINMASSAGYIASGTQILLVSGTTTNATLAVTNTGVYRFSTAISNSNVVLNVGRVSTSSVVASDQGKAIANVLDHLGVSSTGTLATVQGVIGAQGNAAGVNNVINSLTPGIDGAGIASVNITVDTGNQISNRLASVRSTSGVATGDPMANNHMWIQGFGSTESQDDHGGNYGYDANSGGVSVGVDTDTLADGYTTGVAVSYGHGTVDSNSPNNASTDIDTYVGTLYGSRVLDDGIFINGQLGFGYNKYDIDRTILGVGSASGSTNGWQGTAKVEGGRDYAAGKFTLTPLASLQYTYLDMDSYTETGAGGASLRVNPDSLSTVDAGAGGQLAYAIPLTDGGTLKPSVHAKYIYRFGDTDLSTTSQFTGGGSAFNTGGVKADRSSVNLGAGLLLTTVAGTDLSLNYDADIRSNLVGHTGQLKARWAF